MSSVCRYEAGQLLQTCRPGSLAQRCAEPGLNLGGHGGGASFILASQRKQAHTHRRKNGIQHHRTISNRLNKTMMPPLGVSIGQSDAQKNLHGFSREHPEAPRFTKLSESRNKVRPCIMSKPDDGSPLALRWENDGDSGGQGDVMVCYPVMKISRMTFTVTCWFNMEYVWGMIWTCLLDDLRVPGLSSRHHGYRDIMGYIGILWNLKGSPKNSFEHLCYHAKWLVRQGAKISKMKICVQ